MNRRTRILAILATTCFPSVLAAQGSGTDPFPALIAKARREASSGQISHPPGDNLTETLGQITANIGRASHDDLQSLAELYRDVGARVHSSAAAAAPSQPATIVVTPKPADDPGPHAHDLYQRGQDTEALGDLNSARRFYRLSAEAGYAPAAVALGQLYDPAYLARHPVFGGITADPAEARRWYERAQALGDKSAAERVAALPK